MTASLLYSYHRLLKEYDKVLTLTDKLLSTLQSGETDNDFISSLINKRHKSVKLIQKMTEKLSNFNPSDSQKADPQMIAELKSLHLEIEHKTDLLHEKEIELEKIVDDLN
jgi:arginine deiminase